VSSRSIILEPTNLGFRYYVELPGGTASGWRLTERGAGRAGTRKLIKAGVVQKRPKRRGRKSRATERAGDAANQST
jgi:hypothetical protein